MITLDSGGTAGTPLASQVQVVGRLATDVAFTNMILLRVRAVIPSMTGDDKVLLFMSHQYVTYIESLSSVAALATTLPLAGQVVDG